MRLNRRVVRNSLSEMELARGKMLSHQLGVQAMPVKLRIDVLRVPEPAKRYADYSEYAADSVTQRREITKAFKCNTR